VIDEVRRLADELLVVALLGREDDLDRLLADLFEHPVLAFLMSEQRGGVRPLRKSVPTLFDHGEQLVENGHLGSHVVGRRIVDRRTVGVGTIAGFVRRVVGVGHEGS
jgi:plasmid stabilization system protein ParE